MALGRPKKEIDYETVEKLAHIQCTIQEIASFLNLNTKTLTKDKTFTEIYKKAMDEGKMSLRRQMWEKAKGGNTTMLIWLSKQYLSFVDNREELDIRKEELRLKLLQVEPPQEKAIKESWFIDESKEHGTKEN